jgi:hypothetical protein
MSRQFKVPVNLVSLTTDPNTAAAGDIYFNSNNSKIRFYSGTEWLDIGSGSGGTVNHTHDYNGNVIVGAGGSIVTTATFAAGAPNNLNGGNGDVYLDITNLDVYVKSAGSWGSPTEINVYTKQEIDTLLSAKAPINNPTFTGTVSGITASMVGLGNVNNTSDANKPISTATQTALDGKASVNHNHTVSNITDLTASAAELNLLDGVTATTAEINYLSGLTDNIQDQLDSVGNSLGDYIPLNQLGVAGGVAQININSQIVALSGGIKFSDNTVQTTAVNTSSFATSSQLSDVEVLALAGL